MKTAALLFLVASAVVAAPSSGRLLEARQEPAPAAPAPSSAPNPQPAAPVAAQSPPPPPAPAPAAPAPSPAAPPPNTQPPPPSCPGAAPAAPAASAVPADPEKSCIARKYDEISRVVKKCKTFTLQDIRIPKKKYIDLRKLKEGATVTFAGTTTVEYYKLEKSDESDKVPIQIGGTDITVQGAPGSLIDGNGAAWWDGFGSNNPNCNLTKGGQRAARCNSTDAEIPRISKPNYLIKLSKLKGSKNVVKDLVIKNYPAHGISIRSSQGLTMQNITVDMRDGDAPNNISMPLSAAHNTDGVGVASSKHIVIKDSHIYNQDDCVAITSGTNIEVANLTCIGGHGFSIGSVGGKEDNNVRDIYIHDGRAINQTNALRIKTVSGAQGSVTNITFANMAITNALDYGVVIQQDYLNGGPTCTPTEGVKIDGVTVRNVTGTVNTERPKAMGVYVLCGKNTCSNFNFDNVKIEGGKRNSCNDKTSGMALKGDFQCADSGPNCKDNKNLDEQP